MSTESIKLLEESLELLRDKVKTATSGINDVTRRLDQAKLEHAQTLIGPIVLTLCELTNVDIRNIELYSSTKATSFMYGVYSSTYEYAVSANDIIFLFPYGKFLYINLGPVGIKKLGEVELRGVKEKNSKASSD